MYHLQIEAFNHGCETLQWKQEAPTMKLLEKRHDLGLYNTREKARLLRCLMENSCPRWSPGFSVDFAQAGYTFSL